VRIRQKDGLALIATLMVLVLIMPLIAVSAGISIARRQSVIVDEWTARAFYAADGGWRWAVGEMDNVPGLGIGQVQSLGTVQIDEQLYAEVTIKREGVDSVGASRDYVIYSRGFTTPNFVSKTVAVNVRVTADPPWDLYAPLVSMNGSHKNGNAGIMEGHARCPLGEAVAGIIAPDSSVSESGHGTVEPGDSLDWLNGDPPLVYDSQENLIDLLGFDEWPDVRDNIVVDAETPNKKAWPTDELAQGDWMSIRLTDSHFQLRSGHSGQGILIVPGDLDVGGGFTWDGLLLVGGGITVNGDITIHGSILAGLNAIDGTLDDSTPIDVGNGTVHIQYDLCVVMESLMAGNIVANDTGGWREVN